MDPGLLRGSSSPLGEGLGVQAFLDQLRQLSDVFLRQPRADPRKGPQDPHFPVQPSRVVRLRIEGNIRVNHRPVKNQRVVEHNAGIIGDQQVGAVQRLEIVLVEVPFQPLLLREKLPQPFDHLLLRGHGLRMGPDDQVISGLTQALNHFLPEAVEQAVGSPARRQQDGGLMGRSRTPLQPSLPDGVHVRQPGQHAFLGRQMPERLQAPHLPDLILSAQQQRVVVVGSEHPVGGHSAGGVEHVHIPFDLRGSLPLVDIQPRRAGQHDIRPQHVHPGKGPVPFPDKLRLHVLIFLVQQRIIRGGGQVMHGLPALLHLVAQGLENRPVPPAVGKKDEGHRGILSVSPPSAAQQAFQLHPQAPEGIDGGARRSDQDGEEHAPRAGINIKEHRFILRSLREGPSCFRRTGIRFSASA